VIDFKFFRDAGGAGPIDIRHTHQTSFRDQASKILGVTFSHFSDTQQPHAQLVH